ncbi:MAG TPA: SpoIIE family protein phosphatase [Tissierellaceae bacterium]
MLGIKAPLFNLEDIEKHYKLNYHVLESMADWVRILDKNGQVVYANRAMKETLGNDIINRECNINCKQNEPCCFCIVERSIQGGETIQKEEIIDGKYYSVKASPIRDSKGEILGAVEVFRDVNRERSLEKNLRAKNAKMSKDLKIARRIQEKILPRKGQIGKLYIDYIYKPSEMLSGDMFDIFQIDEDNIGIYISDVSGHGVSASMMTMFIRQSMRFIKDDILSPSEALVELHKRFSTLELEIDKYFTIFYGVFNKNTYEFRYANAGHNSIPLRYDEDKEVINGLEISGFPISLLFDKVEYKERKIQLEKGDKLLFYTDGVTEVRNSKDIEFGIGNIIKSIKNSNGNVLNDLVEGIGYYGQGDIVDDFAIILVEVLS